MEKKVKKLIINKMVDTNNAIIDTIYSLDENSQSQIFNDSSHPISADLVWLKKTYTSLTELIRIGNNL